MIDKDIRIRGQIERLRSNLEDFITKRQDEIEEQLAAHRKKIDALYLEEGVYRCPQCNGHGATQRLDSGYMKKFGLREWDGCGRCGGDGNEIKGKGYLPIRWSV